MAADYGLGQMIGLIGGLALEGHEDQRQVNQQRDLQNLQLQGAQYLNGMALENWKQTSYPAQVEQLKKAGLNPGLLYAKGGPGGMSITPPTPTGGQAHRGAEEIGMAMQIGIQSELLSAQKDLIKAQTANVQANTAKTEGVDTKEGEQRITESTNRIEQLKKQTENTVLQNAILQYEGTMKAIDANIKDKTQDNIISESFTALEKLASEAQSARNAGRISEETANNVIQQINNNTQEQQLRMAAQRAGLIKTGAEINQVNTAIQKLNADIRTEYAGKEQKWMQLDQNAKELAIKQALMKQGEAQTEFNTSTPQQIKQWTSIITDLLRTPNR